MLISNVKIFFQDLFEQKITGAVSFCAPLAHAFEGPLKP
jgi:hypothetical protein